MSVGNIIFCVLVGIIVLGIWLYLLWWDELADNFGETIVLTLAGLVVIGIGESALYSQLESSESFRIGDAIGSLIMSIIMTIPVVFFLFWYIYFMIYYPICALSGTGGFKTLGTTICSILLPLIGIVLFSSWVRSLEITDPNIFQHICKWIDIIHVVIWIIGSIIVRIYNRNEQNKTNNRKRQNELHDEKVAIYNSIKQSEKELDALKERLNKRLTISNMVTLLDCCGESTYDINKNLKPYYDELNNIKSEIQNKEDEVNNLKAEHERKNKL